MSKRLKLNGVELVKERRQVLQIENPALDGDAWIDYAVVYVELEGGIRIELIRELADGMFDHYVSGGAISVKYMGVEGVDVEVEP